MAESRFVYVTYIAAAPEKVWEALVTPAFVKAYFFGVAFDTDWRAGSAWKMRHPDGRITDSGEILEFDAPRRLVMSWRNEFMPEATAEGYGRLVAEVEAVEAATRLTITHTSEVENSHLIAAVSGGWPRILSNLKSLLETGAPVLPVKS